MQLDPNPNPGTLSGRHASCFLRLIGLPFFCVGILVMAGYLGLFEIQMEGGGPMPFGIACVFLFTFGGVGFGLLTHGRGFLIDKEQRSVHTWRRVILRWAKSRDLDRFDEVRIDKRIIQGEKSSRTVYPVQLGVQDSEHRELDLLLAPNFIRARQTAEAVAKFLHWPLTDLSEGETRRRQPEDLDRSVRAQTGSSGVALELPELPKSRRLRLDTRDGTVTLDIAPPGFTTLHIALLLCVLMGLSVLGGLFWAFFLADADLVFQVIAPLVFFSPGILLLGLILQHAKRGWRLKVGKGRLQAWATGFPPRAWDLSLDEIEEVSRGAKVSEANSPLAKLARHAVVLCTDQQLVTLGGSLNQAEGDYLEGLLRSLLAAPGAG